MAKVFQTPGVYIEEKSAFSNSIVPLPSAVPAFIGYTQKASRGQKNLTNVPTRISSLAEYIDLFGGAPNTTFTITPNDTNYYLEVNKNSQYLLFNAIRLFFANGGGNCYIVSVGDYNDAINLKTLKGIENNGGLTSLLKEPEPTMVVIPDAVLLKKDECYDLYQAVLRHCGLDTKNRMAILDIHNGYQDRTFDNEDVHNTFGNKDVIKLFRKGIGNDFLSFAAAYYPWLNTTIVQSNEVSYSNISNIDNLVTILNTGVEEELKAGFLTEKRANAIKAEIVKLKGKVNDITLLNHTLIAVSPIYKDILSKIHTKLNILPPSAALAGAYSLVDNSIGVHKAPANVSLGSVVSPTVNITNEQQANLNFSLDGKAVNAIRSFIGKGVLVWGARTLDGNSQDWRYISVRRTIIMIEQSIKFGIQAYVFEPNNQNTWSMLKASIDNFLNMLWKGGTLVGSSSSEAFETNIGLGVTMTPNDVLDNIMRVTVKVAVSRPAEFIVITFKQEMQKS